MSSSKGSSQSRSQSQSLGSSFVDPNQVPFLRSLFESGAFTARQQSGEIGGAARDLSGRLGRTGSALLGGIEDIAGGRLGPGVAEAIGGLTNLGSSDTAQALTDRLLGRALPGQSSLEALAAGGGVDELLGPNPALEGSLGALDAAIQNNLRTTLGTIGSQASLAGATGGSRQALASGLAGQEAQRTFASGASDLIRTDFSNRQNLAPALQQIQLGAADSLAGRDLQVSGLLDSLLGREAGALSAGGALGAGTTATQLGAGSAGLDRLGGLFDLGLAPFGAEFSPLLALRDILGPSTVLNRTESSSTGRSDASSFGVGI